MSILAIFVTKFGILSKKLYICELYLSNNPQYMFSRMSNNAIVYSLITSVLRVLCVGGYFLLLNTLNLLNFSISYVCPSVGRQALSYLYVFIR